MNTTTADLPLFIEGDGEMARLVNNHDWQPSSLGSRQYWPGHLASTVQLLLDSSLPMFLFWGKNAVCFYNDAAVPTLGIDKHPYTLGSHGKLALKENWALLEPMIDRVKESGKSTFHENVCIPVQCN